MPDSLRLALGTFTAVPVPAPRRVDRAAARGAMLWAPWIGLLLALPIAAAVALVRAATSAGPDAPDLLLAALAVAALAVATRFLHLDGLADTADAFGAKGTGPTQRERRLAVMRRPDTGAFGVAALALVLLVQVAALTGCLQAGHGPAGFVLAVVTGRLAATCAASAPVPAARRDGLGAAVAGSVPVRAAVLTGLAVLLLAAAVGAYDDPTARLVVVLPASVLLGAAAAAATSAWSVRALGGITGDTLGATVEVATTTALVATALLA